MYVMQLRYEMITGIFILQYFFIFMKRLKLVQGNVTQHYNYFLNTRRRESKSTYHSQISAFPAQYVFLNF
jgi:hypothetical protein